MRHFGLGAKFHLKLVKKAILATRSLLGMLQIANQFEVSLHMSHITELGFIYIQLNDITQLLVH